MSKAHYGIRYDTTSATTGTPILSGGINSPTAFMPNSSGYPSTGVNGYACSGCHSWVTIGSPHQCPTSALDLQQMNAHLTTLASLMEAMLARLEELVAKFD